jgi:benzoyl-CoA reductase/2-hydroxyglutaryl-CoA dehydratase subunit BcrC/BadD/HgdB
VCDQTPKVDELIGQRYGVPVAYLDGVLDEWQRSWPGISDRRLKYLVFEAKYALNKFQEVTGCAATEELAKRANLREIDLARRCTQMFNLLGHADPVPMSFADIGATARLILAVNTTTFYKNMEGLADLVCKELKEKIDKEEGILPKGTPKVGIQILWCDPAPVKIIEQAGLAATMDLANPLFVTELERGIFNRDDFWEFSADLVLHLSCMKYAKRIIQVCKESGLDGVILNYPVGCRDLCVGAIESKERITQELGIPVLLLESDHVDTRNYSAEAMRSRVEAYAEILTANRGVKTR